MRALMSTILFASLLGCEEYQAQSTLPATTPAPNAIANESTPLSIKGEIGSSKELSVEVCGISGERLYLDKLRCADGSNPTLSRAGNVGPRYSTEQLSTEEMFAQLSQEYQIPDGVEDQHIIDAYDVSCGEKTVKMYLDMYHCTASSVDSEISGLFPEREDIEEYANRSPASCKVKDPDIGSFYYGDCDNGHAHGVGVAIGRDEYRGEFYEGEAHGTGIYIWGPGSNWSSERHLGNFDQGDKNGFGVTSVSVNSAHVHLDWYEKNALLEGDQLVLRGIFVDHAFVLACESPRACQNKTERLGGTSTE